MENQLIIFDSTSLRKYIYLVFCLEQVLIHQKSQLIPKYEVGIIAIPMDELDLRGVSL